MRAKRTETIYKGLRYRIYPTAAQDEVLRQHGGNTRFLWNQMLALNQIEHRKMGKFVFSSAMHKLLPEMKRKRFPFLKVSHSQSLQQVCKNLDAALKGCFQDGKGFPQFKRKDDANDSFTIHQRWKHRRGALKIPKVGWVRWVKHRPLEGIPKSITVSQDGDRWYVSIKCEVHIKRKPRKNHAELDIVGVDVGLKDLATCSNGYVEPNPRHLRNIENALKRAQREVSRKKKGSNNRKKAVLRLRRVYRKLRFARRDTLDKLSHRLVKNHDAASLEDLNIAGMMKNHCLARAIADVGWGELRRQLEYKADWSHKHVVFVDRFFPSSKRCSACHEVKRSLTLSERVYHCAACGFEADRDLNAAVNIEQEGRRTLAAA